MTAKKKKFSKVTIVASLRVFFSIFYSRTVSKEGANKGRPFYCCAKPRGQGCDFFEWGDTTGPSSANSKPGRSASTNNGGTRKRKCGLCHQEGRIF